MTTRYGTLCNKIFEYAKEVELIVTLKTLKNSLIIKNQQMKEVEELSLRLCIRNNVHKTTICYHTTG
jgi:hypothetical protein